MMKPLLNNEWGKNVRKYAQKPTKRIVIVGTDANISTLLAIKA